MLHHCEQSLVLSVGRGSDRQSRPAYQSSKPFSTTEIKMSSARTPASPSRSTTAEYRRCFVATLYMCTMVIRSSSEALPVDAVVAGVEPELARAVRGEDLEQVVGGDVECVELRLVDRGAQIVAERVEEVTVEVDLDEWHAAPSVRAGRCGSWLTT